MGHMKAWKAFAILAITLAGVGIGSARAESVSGRGILCDTVEQLERYVALVQETRASSGAIQRINAEARDTVCAVLNAVYERGDPLKRLDTFQGPAEITPIMVFAVIDGDVVHRLSPIPQFTLFAVDAPQGVEI
jgi:hypothetical protein